MTRTRMFLLSVLGLPVTVGVAAAAEPRVIATNVKPTPVVSPAVLGAPVVVPNPVETVAYQAPTTVRAQAVEPAWPVPSSPAVTQLPNPTPIAPVPMTATPMPQWPTPVAPMPQYPAMGSVAGTGSVPCTNCNPPPFDPVAAPLPGGPVVPFSPYAADTSRPWIYGSAEYLMWWIRDGYLPPLVATGPVTEPFRPYDQFLAGNGPLDLQSRAGARLTLGTWLPYCTNWGVVGSAFFLGQRSNVGYFDSTRTPALGRPFINAATGTLDTNVVGQPGVSSGNISYELTNTFWGADINFRKPWLCKPCGRVDLLFGYRHLDFSEDLTISENATYVRDVTLVDQQGRNFVQLPAGTGRSVTDRFEVANDFNGGQIGLMAERRWGRWSIDMTGKVAFGQTRQRLSIAGSEVVTLPGTATIFNPPPEEPSTRGPGREDFNEGLYARNSNIGAYDSSKFSVIPEVGFNVGYHLTPNTKVFVGYNFLYWSNVLRAGDQIDPVVNTADILFLPPTNSTARRPAVLMKETDFWAQGVSFGLSCQW